MNLRTLFIETVQGAIDLPEPLRTHAAEVTSLEECRFDRSYIDFLDEQIRLNARGREWSESIQRRRAAFQPFCDIPLLRGTVIVGNNLFIVRISPASRNVVHWETHILQLGDDE